IGLTLFAFAVVGARERPGNVLEGQLGRVRSLVSRARVGLAVMRQPVAAAALVLLMMNVVTVLPFWPGNIGLVQAAVAVSLRQYGVDYGKGFAYGVGLQLIEASVGLGVGTVFLAREGLSFATLKGFESGTEGEEPPGMPGPVEPRSTARAR